MKILGIESSCDETAASVVENGTHILSNVVVSQIDIFAAYGGVIPEVAARSHLEAILPVVNKALEDANCTWDDIDAIAVTHAPGLLGSLLIGTLTARTLAILHDKPLYAVHHLKSHIYANWLRPAEKPNQALETVSREPYEASEVSEAHNDGPERTRSREPDLVFPLLALVISGGHTQILYMKRHNDFTILGTTHDDAIGECFDKVAKILGLPYPGGPAIAKAAENGDPHKYNFPHPKAPNYDFSFSGLKTAVLRAVQKDCNLPISHPSHDLKNHLTKQQIADFAASFQNAATDILLEKLSLALADHPEVKTIALAGGVSANALLRKKTESLYADYSEVTTESKRRTPVTTGCANACPHRDLSVFIPDISLSGDNAAMVASACFYEIESGVQPTDPYHLDIYPRISIS